MACNISSPSTEYNAMRYYIALFSFLPLLLASTTVFAQEAHINPPAVAKAPTQKILLRNLVYRLAHMI